MIKMSTAEVKQILAKCFAALSKAQLNNLEYHRKKNTPICCGNAATLFTDGRGGG